MVVVLEEVAGPAHQPCVTNPTRARWKLVKTEGQAQGMRWGWGQCGGLGFRRGGGGGMNASIPKHADARDFGI